MKHHRILMLLTSITLGLLGCSVDASKPTSQNINDAPPSSKQSAAIEALATKLNLDKSQIKVISVAAVDWPNGAIGCPEPNRFYSMALIAGERIILEANGQSYQFNASTDGAPFLCPADRAQPGYERYETMPRLG